MSRTIKKFLIKLDADVYLLRVSSIFLFAKVGGSVSRVFAALINPPRCEIHAAMFSSNSTEKRIKVPFSNFFERAYKFDEECGDKETVRINITSDRNESSK